MLSMAVAKYHGLAKRRGRGRRRGVDGEWSQETGERGREGTQPFLPFLPFQNKYR
jgi:hypothetical protein